MIFGWFGDNTKNIDFVKKVLIPTSTNAIYALDYLKNNQKKQLIPETKGFKEIIIYWPNRDFQIQNVGFIDRGNSFMNSRNVTMGYYLDAYDTRGNKIDNQWSDAEARDYFLNLEQRKLFWFSGFIFWLGFFITAISGILEFYRKRIQ